MEVRGVVATMFIIVHESRRCERALVFDSHCVRVVARYFPCSPRNGAGCGESDVVCLECGIIQTRNGARHFTFSALRIECVGDIVRQYGFKEPPAHFTPPPPLQ